MHGLTMMFDQWLMGILCPFDYFIGLLIVMLYKSIYPHPQTPLPSPIPKETLHIHFPEDIQIIIRSDRPNYGNLYLGNIQAALNPTLLATHQITSLLSVAKGYQPHHSKEVIRHHQYLPIQDSHADIHVNLLAGVDFISQQLLVSNVLVHCVAGLGRSACFVIAYLMKSQRMSLDEAINGVKSKRKMVQISQNMRQQLKKFQLDTHNQAGRRNKYSYSVRVNSVSCASSIPQSYFKHEPTDHGSILAELYTQKDKVIELDQSQQIQQKSSVSKRSKHLSKASKSNFGGIKSQNPEQKALQNSILANSVHFDMPIQQPLMSKRKSSSRAQYEKKINMIQSRNSQINQALTAAQTKYQNQLKASKITFHNSASKQIREQPALRVSSSNFFKGLLEQ